MVELKEKLFAYRLDDFFRWMKGGPKPRPVWIRYEVNDDLRVLETWYAKEVKENVQGRAA